VGSLQEALFVGSFPKKSTTGHTRADWAGAPEEPGPEAHADRALARHEAKRAARSRLQAGVFPRAGPLSGRHDVDEDLPEAEARLDPHVVLAGARAHLVRMVLLLPDLMLFLATHCPVVTGAHTSNS